MAPFWRNFFILLGIVALVGFLISVLLPIVLTLVLVLIIAGWINHLYRRRRWGTGVSWYFGRWCRRYR